MQDIGFADGVKGGGVAQCRALRPARVLGIDLADYSVGHELMLLELRNALVFLDERDFAALSFSEQAVTVMEAAWVCSNSWMENHSRRGWRWHWLWCRRLRWTKPDWALAVAEFRNYRREGSTVPVIVPSESIMHRKSEGGRALGSPLLAGVLRIGFELLGPARGYDLPLGMGQWLYFERAERDGGLQVANGTELQGMAEERQHREDYEREQSAKNGGPS
jgi:hypothetical protein